MPDRYLAIDIGANRLAAGVVGADGSVLVRDRVATPARHVWPSLVSLIRRVLAAAPDDDEPTACGVACSGPIDRETGRFTAAQVSAWAGFPLHDELATMTGLPVAIDQPGRALAAAELWCGVGGPERPSDEIDEIGDADGSGHPDDADGVDGADGDPGPMSLVRDFITISVGDTVDAGVVTDGRLLDGRNRAVGQIGHLLVEPDGRQCICGALGCLDAYASSSAIEIDTNRPLARTPPSIVERTGVMLARAIASLATMTDPRLVLVAGHVPAMFGDALFDAMGRELEQRLRLGHLAMFEVRPHDGAAGSPLVAAAAVARRHLALAGSSPDPTGT